MSPRSRKKSRLLHWRVVLDTNVFLSGVLWPASAPGRIIRLWKNGHLQLFLNEDIRKEYLEVLSQFLNQSVLSRWQKWLTHPALISAVHIHLPHYPELRDPSDNPFLATAVFAQARYLISRDKDLLVLKKFHEVEIVKPEEFIEQYRARRS
ncbi:putative toxin-antitoxin system toxin component, PIN family [candidate division KSB1 bacterium]|nr:putative toxin-antitoxin system toxin component, PIN family [bacterium]NUM67812.1 putative toxin-antitoxin system toxin component, PIN family [candidate division KSB1 bacterium]